jgi:dipeptidyl aminopeptidase/acylaminoacyl peptidase
VRRACLVVVLIISMQGCARASSPPKFKDLSLTGREIVPSADYVDLAWISADLLIVDYDLHLGPSGSKRELRRLNPAGTTFSRIDIWKDPSCWRTDFYNLSRLPDGRLGMVRACDQELESRKVATSDLIAFNPADGSIESLSSLADPRGRNADSWPRRPFAPLHISWNPTMTRGLFGRGSGICAGIGSFERGSGIKPLRLQLGEGSKRWRLDKEMFREESSCDRYGRAAGPEWSPDGSRIALFASPPGASGFARMDQPWQLQLVDPNTLEVQKSLEGVFHFCCRSTWSPDGKTLAFDAEIGGRSGIWLFSPDDDNLSLISSHNLCCPTWAPDGRTMAAIRKFDDTSDRGEIVLLELDDTQDAETQA